jgi:hypothetical protein
VIEVMNVYTVAPPSFRSLAFQTNAIAALSDIVKTEETSNRPVWSLLSLASVFYTRSVERP